MFYFLFPKLVLLIDIQATIGIDFLSKTMYLEDRTVRLQLWWDFSSWCFRPVCIIFLPQIYFCLSHFKIFIFWSCTAMVAKALRSGWTSGSILMLNQKKKKWKKRKFYFCLFKNPVSAMHVKFVCIHINETVLMLGTVFFPDR